MKYHDVLKSERWRALKWRRILHADYRCEDCGLEHTAKRPRQAMKMFELHHVTYERVGRELLSDVRILCPECHARRHGLRRVA